MKRAIELDKYKGFKFDNGDERFTHMQYADDTLIIRKRRDEKILKSSRQI